MLYSSRNGCFYYYDSVLYAWHIAEPTLLFLLGLESITSYDKSITDSIVISKYVYKSYLDTVEPLEHIHNIYDDIYSFLSGIGPVEDNEDYLKFNCYGLKLTLNNLTGTGDDRTVPFIFKYDKNKSLVDPANVLDSNSNLSYYDVQAQRIYDVFGNIGYDTSLEESGISDYIIDRNKNDSTIRSTLDILSNKIRTSDDSSEIAYLKNLRETIIGNLQSYNSKVSAIHKKKLSDSEIYRLLDYKAMYAYSLGVLYGCSCLGFDDSIIWRLDPKVWYNGTYFNLVRTAWFVFRFHWAYTLSDVTNNNVPADQDYTNKYQGIQDNKIWNFTNDGSLVNAPLAADETDCFCLYLNNKEHSKDYLRTVSDKIIYSHSTSPDDSENHNYPGSYLLKFLSLKDGTITWKWNSIDSKVSAPLDSSLPLKGVISTHDMSLTRYIGSDPVIIYRAFKYKDNDSNNCYLSPSYEKDGDIHYKKYYVYTGDLGWVDYTEDLLLDITDGHPGSITDSLPGESADSHMYLDIVPKAPSVKSLHYAFPIDSNDNDYPGVITYYKCYVTDHWDSSNTEDPDGDSDILYGIYNKYINADDSTSLPTHFDYIISKARFDTKYSSSVVMPDDTEYNASYTCYDLNVKMSLAVVIDSNIPYILDPNASDSGYKGKSIYYYGYSEQPSRELPLYNLHTNSDLNHPHTEIFRFYTDANNNNKYWSESYFINLDGENQVNRTWRSFNELSNYIENYNTFLYSLTNDVINIYKGETRVISDTPLYNNYINKVQSSLDTHLSLDEYIYGDTTYLLNTSSTPVYNFILLGDYSDNINEDSLYYKGMTKYLCPFVFKDDDGNSLLDDSNSPLVWYDPKNKVYWNGLYNINRWQSTKPSRSSKCMYDAITNAIISVFDHMDDQLISIDGADAITYDEFYSHSNYGVVRTTLQVFNPSISTTEIKDCYCDTKLDPNDYTNALYCIPGVTGDAWVTRSDITNAGWWFVDGTAILYSGSHSGSYVVDDDHTD